MIVVASNVSRMTRIGLALGRKNGMLSILVMTGETTEEMLNEAEGDNVPDLVFDRIADIPVGE